MSGKSENVIGAIEFGTSSVRVLLGRLSAADGRVGLLGFGEIPAAGAVVKGEIVDMAKARELLVEALEAADRQSGGAFADCSLLCLNVTGSDLYGVRRSGVATVQNEDGRVGEPEKELAYENALRAARNSAASEGMTVLSGDASGFTVDSGTPALDPAGMRAEKLETAIYCVMAPQKYLDQLSGAVRDVCSDDSEDFVHLVFSALAAQFGAVGEAERERGALLIDLGAGSTEYALYHHFGLQSAGVLAVGFEHVLNDLSIALQLPVENMRNLASDGTLNKLFAEPRDFFPVPSPHGRVRQVPSVTMETVVNARLDEIFDIVRSRVASDGYLPDANYSIILTGGGALFSPTLEAAQQAFQAPVYIGTPKTPDPKILPEDPRYAALYGALCYAQMIAGGRGLRRKSGLSLLTILDAVWNGTTRQWNRFAESFGLRRG